MTRNQDNAKKTNWKELVGMDFYPIRLPAANFATEPFRAISRTIWFRKGATHG